VVAVDTNVVIRLLTLDDDNQAARAKRLFASNHIFLPKTVLLETEWVLRRLYRLKRKQVTSALRALIALDDLYSEDSNAARVALDWADQGLDFADALHLASSHPARRFATFDMKLKARAERLHGPAIEEP